MAQNKPDFRTVEVNLSAPFDGWKATMRAEGIPARIFIELQSGNVERSMKAVDLDETGEPAATVLDAPMDALTDAIGKWSDAVAALPPR